MPAIAGMAKVTVRISDKIYKRYKKFCKENAVIISKRLEILMEKDMSEILVGLPKVKL